MRVRAGSLSELLDRWFAAASTDWSASTLRETKSLLEHHLKPHLGHLLIAKLTPCPAAIELLQRDWRVNWLDHRRASLMCSGIPH